jgi:acetate kinase
MMSTPLLAARLTGLDQPEAALRWSAESGDAQAGQRAPGTAETALPAMLHEAVERLGGRRVRSVGHRIVHGGLAHAGPAFLDAQTMAGLEALIPLAPRHQPANLAGVHAAADAWPEANQIGCFDTAFHRRQPRPAQLFGLPLSFAEEGMVRYGFHGLSYAHIAGVLPSCLDGRQGRRVIAAHLGAGASMCAMLNGRSVATTMGFTALDGLPMATRCGAIDPGLVLYLIEQCGMSAATVRELLYEKSGLLGLSRLTGDMRLLLESDEPDALTAVEYFCYRARREIGSLAAALGGLDAIVFTGGVGENAPAIRAAVCAGLEWLGVSIDPAANEAGRPCISAADSPVSAWVIPANEEWVIAKSAYAAASA